MRKLGILKSTQKKLTLEVAKATEAAQASQTLQEKKSAEAELVAQWLALTTEQVDNHIRAMLRTVEAVLPQATKESSENYSHTTEEEVLMKFEFLRQHLTMLHPYKLRQEQYSQIAQKVLVELPLQAHRLRVSHETGRTHSSACRRVLDSLNSVLNTIRWDKACNHILASSYSEGLIGLDSLFGDFTPLELRLTEDEVEVVNEKVEQLIKKLGTVRSQVTALEKELEPLAPQMGAELSYRYEKELANKEPDNLSGFTDAEGLHFSGPEVRKGSLEELVAFNEEKLSELKAVLEAYGDEAAASFKENGKFLEAKLGRKDSLRILG